MQNNPPEGNSRSHKVGSVIKKHLSTIIQFELRDPRVSGLVTVSEVKVSPDLSFAKVYIARVGGEPENVETFLEPFRHAKPFFRKRLSQEVKLRIVPELHFVYDSSIEYGDKLSKLIDKLVAEEDESNSEKD